MKKWLLDNFLPMWAKETVLSDNKSLQHENLRLRHKIAELERYIEGLQAGLRSTKRITIYNRGGRE